MATKMFRLLCGLYILCSYGNLFVCLSVQAFKSVCISNSIVTVTHATTRYKCHLNMEPSKNRAYQLDQEVFLFDREFLI